jgi:hypothetical protein
MAVYDAYASIDSRDTHCGKLSAPDVSLKLAFERVNSHSEGVFQRSRRRVSATDLLQKSFELVLSVAAAAEHQIVDQCPRFAVKKRPLLSVRCSAESLCR